MKRVIILVILGCIFNLYCSDISENKLVVEGQSTFIYTSDQAEISLNLKSYGSSLLDASKQNNEKLKELKAGLEQAGISGENVTVEDNRNLESYLKKMFSSKKDFYSEYMISVLIKNLSKMENAIEIITCIEGITIYNTEFSVSDIIKKKNEIIDSATLAAKKKANRIAGLLDIELDGVSYFEVLNLNEKNTDPLSNLRGGRNNIVNYSKNDESVDNLPVTGIINKTEVTCRVKVIYHIKHSNDE